MHDQRALHDLQRAAALQLNHAARQPGQGAKLFVGADAQHLFLGRADAGNRKGSVRCRAGGPSACHRWLAAPGCPCGQGSGRRFSRLGSRRRDARRRIGWPPDRRKSCRRLWLLSGPDSRGKRRADGCDTRSRLWRPGGHTGCQRQTAERSPGQRIARRAPHLARLRARPPAAAPRQPASAPATPEARPEESAPTRGSAATAARPGTGPSSASAPVGNASVCGGYCPASAACATASMNSRTDG